MYRSAPAARPDRARQRLAALLLAAFTASPAGADTAGLTARLALTDRNGHAISLPQAGRDVGIEVALASAVHGDAPRGVRVEGWLRPVSASDLPCRAAAQSFRATRRIPTGGIDLNGILLVAFNEDGSFGITDPRLDLATANMVAAGHTGAAPPRLVAADPTGQRVWLRDPASGAVQALSMDGRIESLPRPDLGPLLALVPDGTGGVWVAGPRGVQRLGADEAGPRLGIEGEVLGLRPAGPRMLVAWTADRLTLADRRSGAVIGVAQPEGGIRAADAVTLTDAQGGTATVTAVLAADGMAVRLIWDDAPDAGQPPIALPAPASRVDIHPENGKVLLWGPGGVVSVVDPVSGRLAGSVALHEGIGAVTFADRAAFLMAPDGSAVTVLDLASLDPGEAPTLQQVRLGPRAARPADPAAVEGLLASLSPAPRAIAVHAESYTMFVIEARDSMGEAPPMTGGRLRGGRPERIAVLDRSFRETSPGRFATRATIPTPGPWELVLTTGIGGLSTCFRMDVAAGPDAPPASAPPQAAAQLVLDAEALAAGAAPGTIRLSLADEQGARLAIAGVPRVSVTSLELGFQADAQLVAAGPEALTTQVSLPVPGLYVIRLDGAGPVLPAILEVPR